MEHTSMVTAKMGWTWKFGLQTAALAMVGAANLAKKGNPALQASWRFIFVKCQQGLMQEGLLTQRLLSDVRADLVKGQSGYWRGVDAPHLLLHEICACSLNLSLCLWLVFGDFVKAFPKTWRDALLCLLHDGPFVKAGCLAELGSILEKDVLHICNSGCSTMDVLLA